MSDTTTTEAAAVAEDTTKNAQVADESTASNLEVVPGEEALGDPGKKALDTMKAERNAAKAEAAQAKAEAAALLAKIEGKEAEFKAEQERRAVEATALSKANERIKKAEIRALAAGKLNDPADALRYLDLDEIEVSDDGEVDTAAVREALERLISTKPYLAVAQGTRFQGTADQGARKADAKSEEQKLTEALATAAPEQRIAIRQRLAHIRAEAA
ncbi:MAG: hypothetical protein K0S70_202 [Microbacterium sp.]|jgi:hypothetical protein|nr:hypothetical protein [Microbacterium sp.]